MEWEPGRLQTLYANRFGAEAEFINNIGPPAGRLLILQPNVRYCGRDYWQFFDHITPVDDRAVPGGGSAYPALSRPVRGLGTCSSATSSPRAPSRPARPASVTVTARVAVRRSIQRRSSNRPSIRAPSAPAR